VWEVKYVEEGVWEVVCGGGSVGGEVRGGVWEVKQVEECGR